jgi:hypothetical protein
MSIKLNLFAIALFAPTFCTGMTAQAQPAGATRQSVADAWWTGPIIAAGAETLPPGHVLVEPYMFDAISRKSSTPGSLSYLLYGVAPRFTVGVLPTFSYARDAHGDRHLRMGDVTLSFQYRLTRPNPQRAFPSVAIVVQEGLPTANFDRLAVAGSGSGTGTFTTMVGLYSQQYFWLPNGRILRARLNISHTFAGTAHVRGISVYGTDEGFRGTAKPGDTTTVDLASEYSVTKRFVLALDVLHQWNGRTVVRAEPGSEIPGPSTTASRFYAIVPAAEYSWSPNSGVIIGTRVIFRGHNAGSSVTPVIAYNRFF